MKSASTPAGIVYPSTSAAQAADGQRAMESARKQKGRKEEPPDRWLVIIECEDEAAQAEALRLCREAGLECKAVMS